MLNYSWINLLNSSSAYNTVIIFELLNLIKYEDHSELDAP